MGLNSEGADRIVLDLETIPTANVEQWLDPVRPDSRLKDPSKIEASKAEKLATMIEKAGLEPDLCEIVAVGYQIGADDPVVLTRMNYDETDLIAEVRDALGQRVIVGYNCLSFDCLVLMRRAQLLGIPFPALNVDRYRSPHIDLMQKLSFNGALTFRSLSFYRRRFQLDVPDDPTSGADIAALVASGDWEAVKAHCASDVAVTAKLAARLGYL